jgi:hypothetical protein
VEGLIELVAASFARHGIDCPPAESRSAVPASVTAMEKMQALAVRQVCAEATLSVVLPEHNFRKSQQGDPVP